jgi:hypothetical protein
MIVMSLTMYILGMLVKSGGLNLVYQRDLAPSSSISYFIGKVCDTVCSANNLTCSEDEIARLANNISLCSQAIRNIYIYANIMGVGNFTSDSLAGGCLINFDAILNIANLRVYKGNFSCSLKSYQEPRAWGRVCPCLPLDLRSPTKTPSFATSSPFPAPSDLTQLSSTKVPSLTQASTSFSDRPTATYSTEPSLSPTFSLSFEPSLIQDEATGSPTCGVSALI